MFQKFHPESQKEETSQDHLGRKRHLRAFVVGFCLRELAKNLPAWGSGGAQLVVPVLTINAHLLDTLDPTTVGTTTS